MDASYSTRQPSMHTVKELKDLMYNEQLSFRSFYNEVVQILFITKSIH